MTNANLISALRNMVDDIENLGAAPMTVDVSVLRQAIVHLGMLETGLQTIKIQGDLMEVMGNEMRAAGCIYDPESCKVVNTLALPEGYMLVPVKITKEIEDVLNESFEYGYSAESTWDLAIHASSQEVK